MFDLRLGCGNKCGACYQKARKKSEKMADKIADELEEPIEALKGLVVIEQLDTAGEDAAEHLKEVKDQSPVGGSIFFSILHFSRLSLFWIMFHQFR